MCSSIAYKNLLFPFSIKVFALNRGSSSWTRPCASVNMRPIPDSQNSYFVDSLTASPADHQSDLDGPSATVS